MELRTRGLQPLFRDRLRTDRLLSEDCVVTITNWTLHARMCAIAPPDEAIAARTKRLQD